MLAVVNSKQRPKLKLTRETLLRAIEKGIYWMIMLEALGILFILAEF